MNEHNYMDMKHRSIMKTYIHVYIHCDSDLYLHVYVLGAQENMT